MICVYDVGENHYDRLGSCVLTPIKGSHRQIAGGSYELTLEHPIDAGGKWTHLQNGAILKVPVPEETIEDAREGMAADIYRTVAEAELREEPSEPQQINYNAWNPSTSYTVGSKVTCSGWNHRNWQCTFYDETSPQTYVPPYNNNSWWKQIADYTSGSPVIVKLPAGETLYLVEAGEGWYQVITPYGVQGYIKADKVEFVKHVEPGEITSHVITEQLFRITEVDIDNEANKVTAKARHVSYDLNGILCEDMEISQANAAMAISRIAQGLMMDYPGAIATNLTDTAGTYTQSIKGRNGGFCLLDPDRGVLPAFGAMLKRDNWDIFVMKKKHPDRGYRIRYGKNAKGISWQRKVQDLVTRVVPVAKNEDGSNLYLPEKWVDSTHIGEYPTVIMEWLRVDGQVGKDDGTGTDTVWTLENLYTEMRTKAGERFSVDKVDIPAEEVTVNFEQLGDTAEYPWMRERETILLYDKIQAIDERIGLRMDLYVTEIEYDIIRQKVTGVKLSNTDNYRERTVTGFNVQDNSITPRKLTDEVKDSFLASAVGVMPNYANSNTWKPNTASTEGYVQKGDGNANKVWATNGSGEPGWRTPGGYTLPLAADGTRGGVQIGYTQSGKNYPVQLDGEKMYVNVPWTDTKAWDSITGKPETATRWPAWGEVTGKPETFAPSAHTHAWSEVTGKPDTATRWPTWNEVTGKPSSFYTLPLAANGTRGGVQVGYTQSGQNYPVQLSGEKMYVNVPWSDTTYLAGSGLSLSGTTFSVSNGLLSTNYAVRIDTSSGGWALIEPGYARNGFMLKSIRFQANAPNWALGSYSAGIAFGGDDTKGVITVGYDSPKVKIAGGNGDSPVWYFGLTGTSGKTYNFDSPVTSISRSGTTFTATQAGGGTFTFDQQDTNTWRGIQDNLTSSTNTTESLSAKQGYLLANGSARDSTKLPLAGGTMSGKIYNYQMRFLQWTPSDTDNNSYGTSWYGIGRYLPSGDREWLSIANYWGINLHARNNDTVRINGNIIVNGGNYTSYYRPMTSDCTTVPTNTSTCLSGSAGYNLAHGHARDSRVKYFNLSPGAVTTFWINGANSGYVIIWRLGAANSYGIKFGTGTSIVNMMLTGTDYCGVTDNNMTVTIKNNNANYHLRGWVFNNTERADQPDVTD